MINKDKLLDIQVKINVLLSYLLQDSKEDWTDKFDPDAYWQQIKNDMIELIKC